MGNLSGIVCITPDYADQHGLTPVADPNSMSELTLEDDGHWWMSCLLCDQRALSDPGAWGSVAYCVRCWNHFVERRLYPPSSMMGARRMTPAEWGEIPT